MESPKKFSFVSFLLGISLILIVVMALCMYKINKEKEEEISKVNELNSTIMLKQAEIDNLSKKEVVSEEKAEEETTSQISFKTLAGTYTASINSDNDKGEATLKLFANGTYSFSNVAGFPDCKDEGWYSFDDSHIYLHCLMVFGNGVDVVLKDDVSTTLTLNTDGSIEATDLKVTLKKTTDNPGEELNLGKTLRSWLKEGYLVYKN